MSSNTNPYYLEKFVRLKCAPDLLQWGLYPNCKEITEAMAMHSALSHLEGFDLNHAETTAICVGDGVSPRCGAMIAVRSKWRVISIDPNMHDRWVGLTPIVRLTCLNQRIEDEKVRDYLLPRMQHRTVILACHAHVTWDQIMKPLRRSLVRPEQVSLITMPCCVALNPPVEPDYKYRDYRCWSPHNLISIWHNLSREYA